MVNLLQVSPSPKVLLETKVSKKQGRYRKQGEDMHGVKRRRSETAKELGGVIGRVITGHFRSKRTCRSRQDPDRDHVYIDTALGLLER